MTTLAIALGIVILLASVLLAMRGALLAGCAGVLLLGTCFNYQLVSFDVGSGTLTLDRLALVGLVVAYAVQRWRGGLDPKPLGSADLLLLALIALLSLNTLVAGPGSQGGYVSGAWRLVAGYLVPATLYWVGRDAQQTRRGVTALMAVLGLLGAYLAVTGILEIQQRWDIVFPPHIADPMLGLHYGRARGPMLQSISLGIYLGAGGLAAASLLGRSTRGRGALVLLVPLLLAALLFTYTRSVYLGVASACVVWCWLSLPLVWQRSAATLMVATLLGVTFAHHGVLAFERGGNAARLAHQAPVPPRPAQNEAAAPAPSPAGDAAAQERRTPPSQQQSTPPLQQPTEGLADAELPAKPPGLSDRISTPRGTPAETLHSAHMRVATIYVSWRMFLDRPLLGVGLGHYGRAKLPYLEDEDAPASVHLRSIARSEPHNHYLSLLTEVGVLGLALFLALLAAWTRIAWRLHRSTHAAPWVRHHGALLLGVLPIFLVQWAFHELSYAPTDHGLLFLLAGIAVGLSSRVGVDAALSDPAAGPGSARS